ADVTVLAQHMAHRLAEMGLIADDGDVFQYRPNRLVEGVLWVHTTLGGSPPTFSTRLHEEGLAEHRRRWGEHVAQLNGELLDRAPTAYTHLVLIELLSRLDVRSGEVREAVQGLKRLRSDPPVPVARSAGHHHDAPATPPPVDLPAEVHAL